MIAITLAKIGLSTKKWENRISTPRDRSSHPTKLRFLTGHSGRAARGGGRRRRRLDLAVLGLHLLPRPRALQPLDHDPVGRRETRADDAQAVDDGPQFD